MNGSGAYWTSVAIGAVLATVLCVGARLRPGRWTVYAGRALSLVLLADAAAFFAAPLLDSSWSVTSSLPLALCDVVLVVAAMSCWWPQAALPFELTYFLGLAGTLQAVVTPDLGVDYPDIQFFQFVIAHLGIVIAALFLAVGLERRPRPGSVRRVFLITAAYTAFVGVFDWATGANYMYLAQPPQHFSLLSLLGPWPWYIASATCVALVLLLALDTPFRAARRER